MENKNYLIENDADATWTSPRDAQAYANQTSTISGGGRQGYYPVSASSLRYIQQNHADGISGYVSNYSVRELERLFLGSNIRAQDVYDDRQRYEYLGERQLEEQNAAFDYFTNVYTPALYAHQEQVDYYFSLNTPAADLYVSQLIVEWMTGPENTQYQRLTNIYLATSDERSELLRAMNNRLLNGRNPARGYDPYQLDDPTVAEQRRKREELRRQREREAMIDRQIAELAKDNERLKNQQSVRAITAIIGLGFDVATALAVLNIFAGPADEAAIIAGKIGTQEMVERLFSEGGKTAVQNVVKRQLPTQLADDAARVTAEVMLKAPKGKLRDTLVRNLDDAVLKGDTNVVKNLINQADDLLYGTAKSLPKAPKKPPVPKPKSYKIDPRRSNPSNFSSTPRNMSNSYEPEGKLLSEDRKFKILKEIKKPYKVKEAPKKYKMNFAGKYSPQNTPDKTASQITDDLVASGNAKGQKWRHKDKFWQGYETTERFNVIYDKVGHGDQAWNMIVNENDKKRGWRDRKIQEDLNMIAHEKALYEQSIQEQETLQADKDPLFKKVSNKLKRDIDYPDKPSKSGFPDGPPPQTLGGYHPDFVNGEKVSNYYNKLDPISADSMPPTGNPHIDSKVERMKSVKKERDLKYDVKGKKTLKQFKK